VSEFGVDSYSVADRESYESCPSKAYNVTGKINEMAQAVIDVKLWKEVQGHLSVDFNTELCLGGLVHEFNDELWKVGNYHVGLGGLPDISYDTDHSYDDYNAQGFILNSKDNLMVLNEEHFGLVKVNRTSSNDKRIKKAAFFAMKKAFRNQ